ncbi:threonylcarbamoyl-AMP synthase [Staphylococcus muscae]|uniref:Threonylcarbamoyl-AMP synthase n=1 Tax=Staphylococcus muscae TaxID=1294 RepID=A0A240C853_9STAP|nr:L-threonylcarbamoyladenylate synthase [Staphylococcus muscae]AVQ33529.1 threonylcarbamoyl-AMP synthase [Staphylococcus muscae]PNZ05489.1 threonylcarbamoyl-AMP synthase [Staphylococcus muscae]GGA91745.1 threonylcarbamoyl-AMP synthase [Staphylococcus muscae]SNW03463.1 translation factor [Staphylococcus muscae]
MVKTTIWDVREYTNNLIDYPYLSEIIATYRQGGLVALPTETVYGLGADATNEEAVQGIYQAKGRPSDNPLIVHIYDTKQLEDFVENVSETTERLMEAFWPGPITFILPLKPGYLCQSVTGGLNSVAVRMPSHPVARTLLKEVALPIAAPSANLSGRPSPTTFEHVYYDLEGRIDGIIQSTQSEAGLESTVLDCTSFPFRIARPGTITRSMLNEILPNGIDAMRDESIDKPIAPGMKYKHYAPETPLKIFERLNEKLDATQKDWSQTAFILPATLLSYIPKQAQTIILSETESDIKQANHNLYAALHQLDQLDGIAHAYIYGYPDHDDAEALHNRMVKAANHQFIKGEW